MHETIDDRIERSPIHITSRKGGSTDLPVPDPPGDPNRVPIPIPPTEDPPPPIKDPPSPIDQSPIDENPRGPKELVCMDGSL